MSEHFSPTSPPRWISLALAGVVLAAASAAGATEPARTTATADTPCAPSHSTDPAGSLLPAFSPLLGYLAPVSDRSVSLIDSFFLFELAESTPSDDQGISVSATRWDDPDLDRLRRLYDIARPGLQELRGGRATHPSAEFLNALRARRTELSLQDRLFILSMVGEAHPGTGTPEQAIYLAYVARELGFNEVSPEKDLLSYRDPLTQKLFVQKASGIFRSPRTSDSAGTLRDRVSRAEGMLPSADSFRPRTLTWLTDQALLPRDPAPLQARLTQSIRSDETLEQLCLGRSRNCAFTWTAKDPDKLTSATAVGTSTANVPGVEFKLSPAEADQQRGLVRRWEERVPGLPPIDGGQAPEVQNWSISSDGSIHLELKPDNRARLRAQTNFLGSQPEHQIGSRVELGNVAVGKVGIGKVELDLNRRIVGSGSTNVSTTDRISVVIDSRDPDKITPYLKAEGNYYVLRSAGGNETYTGVVGRLKSYLPTEKRGDFYMVLRMSEILNAPSAAAVAGKTSGVGTGAGWSRKLTKTLEFNSELEVNNGASVNDTTTLGVTTGNNRNYSGNIILKSKF